MSYDMAAVLFFFGWMAYTVVIFILGMTIGKDIKEDKEGK